MATRSQSTYGNDLLQSTASCGHPGQCGCLDLAIVCCATCPLPRCRWDAPNEHEEKHRRYEIIVRAIREAPDVPKYTMCRELGVSIKTLERARQWGHSEYARRQGVVT